MTRYRVISITFRSVGYYVYQIERYKIRDTISDKKYTVSQVEIYVIICGRDELIFNGYAGVKEMGRNYRLILGEDGFQYISEYLGNKNIKYRICILEDHYDVETE